MAHLSNHSWYGQGFPPPQAASPEVPLSHLWRLRMELDLWSRPASGPAPVPGYRVYPWRWEDSVDHARVLFRSFQQSPDSEIIPSFRSLEGCLKLVQMVAHNDFFWASATFLARQAKPANSVQNSGLGQNTGSVQETGSGARSSGRKTVPFDIGSEGTPVALIQIMGDVPGRVNLQNIGVDESHRGKGLGRHLLERSIHVLRGWGISRMGLEVTESNEPAVALYRSLGFEVVERLAKPFVPRAQEKAKNVNGFPGGNGQAGFVSGITREETGANGPSEDRSHSPFPRS